MRPAPKCTFMDRSFKSVHQRDGSWKDVPIEPVRVSWFSRLIRRLRPTQ